MDKDVHIDILNKILAQSEELRVFVSKAKESINELDKKLDLHIQKTEMQTALLDQADKEQEEMLQNYHQKFDNFNSKLSEIDELSSELVEKHQEFEKSRDELLSKVENLEKPKRWIIATSKVLIGFGAIASAIYSIYELIQAYLIK